MTALTGETGAGKTLLVEALSLLLGGRADPSVVRAGTDEAVVEGRFVVPAGHRPVDPPDGEPGQGPGDDGSGEVTLARAVPRGGRSRAWVDGRMATIGTLAEVAGRVDRAPRSAPAPGPGPHRRPAPDPRRLRPDRPHRVDGARLRLRQLTDESEALGGDARARAREVDLLRYQIGEIEGAGIEDADEDARLEVEEDRLAAAAAHRQAAAEALAAVSGGEGTSAIDRLAEAAGSLDGRPPLGALDARVRGAMADLGDLASELRVVVETWDDDPDGWTRSGTVASSSTSSCASTVTPSTRSWLSPTTPGPGWTWPRARSSGPRSWTPRSCGPGRAGRAECRGGRRPPGRRPGAGPQDRVHPARTGDAIGPVRDRRGGRRAGRPGRLPPRAPTRGSLSSPWPRRPPEASWPGPCWPSAWPSPSLRA